MFMVPPGLTLSWMPQPELAPVADIQRSLVSCRWPADVGSVAVNVSGAGCHLENLQSEFVTGSGLWVEKQSGCLSGRAVLLALI